MSLETPSVLAAQSSDGCCKEETALKIEYSVGYLLFREDLVLEPISFCRRFPAKQKDLLKCLICCKTVSIF